MTKKKLPNIADITVTFGNAWWPDLHSAGCPQGRHDESDVKTFPSLAALATFIETRRRPLDAALPRDIAKSHQPYIVWAGLKATDYKDRNGDICHGIVRRVPNVMPSRLLPFDIDGASPSALKQLFKAMKGITHFYYYTASDNPMSRRARLVVLCDTVMPYVKEACLRFEQFIMLKLGATIQKNVWTLPDQGTITFDRSMNDPAHYAFLPPGDNQVFMWDGAPVKLAELPELEESMRHSVRTTHHTKDHDKRMAEFRKNPEQNQALIVEHLNTHLKDAANTNARSDGSYGWGRICGALGDFIGTEFEEWAEDVLVSWSMTHGEEWATAAGINLYDWEASIRNEFGKWINPYKTIFSLVKEIREKEKQYYIDSLTDEDLADEDESEEVVLRGKKQLPAIATSFEPYGAAYHAEYDNKGNVTSTYNCSDNLRWVLDKRKAQLCINQMTGQLEMWYSSGRIIQDYDLIVSDLCDYAAFHKIGTATIERHLRKVAVERSYHPVAATLHGYEWDGKKRVDRVLDCFNFEDRDFSHAIMKKWLLSAYAAIAVPEYFEAKLVPILVGGQSAYKSNAVSRIAGLVPRQYHDEQIDLRDKDSLIRATSAHVIEWAEMGNLHKSDVDRVKSFISRKTDTYRAAYARAETRKPRQSVFIGTANDSGRPLLADQSGNLRFAILTLNRIDIDEMNSILGWSYDNGRIKQVAKELLIQFWLEVKSWFDAGESWHVEGELRGKQESVNRQHTGMDPTEVLLREYLEENAGEDKRAMRAGEITKALGLPVLMNQVVGYALKRMVKDGTLRIKDYGAANANRYWWPVPGGTDLDD
ncbi:MAG: hypothetical protein G3W58_22855 [Pantoea ananatis]|nr:hypothetical protein [Pantoea ananatis]